MFTCFVYKSIFTLKSEKHSSKSKKRITVVYMQTKTTIKSLSKWRHPYLIVDISKVLLSASKIDFILLIIKFLSHVNRLNKISGVI